MDLKAELERVVVAADAAGELELGERMRARILALEVAPAGAGWEYLAAMGDGAAMVAVQTLEKPTAPNESEPLGEGCRGGGKTSVPEGTVEPPKRARRRVRRRASTVNRGRP